MKRSPSFQVNLIPSLEKILSPAYRCPEFDGTCHGKMRWEPGLGHVPRGFLGACGESSEVELILVFAEPGDPHDEERDSVHTSLLHSGQTALSRVYEYATYAVEIGHDTFHRNLKHILNMCWPSASFEQQMRKVWLTDSVLCSAPKEGGAVSKRSCITCGEKYLLPQLKLFPRALVVAVGGKARDRLGFLGIDFIHVRSIAPPGCHYKGSRETWEQIPEELSRRRATPRTSSHFDAR
jgi:hypothetical protein